jgi:hypothetical protein
MNDSILDYIPILTSIFSVFFLREIFSHYLIKRKPYLLWWSIGVLTFGLGTLAESINVLFGWTEINAKYWYIVGALLGGFPLAQGSVYLLMNKRFANISAAIVGSIIVVAAVCVSLSPIRLPENFNGELTGRVFAWEWVRYFSPLINLYAFIFLVGGAIYSANKYYRRGIKDARFKGNIMIAIGGLLPGIGGTFTRMGFVQVLYVTEFVGLLLIYAGYSVIKKGRSKTPGSDTIKTNVLQPQ